jgi:hypothetical protein
MQWKKLRISSIAALRGGGGDNTHTLVMAIPSMTNIHHLAWGRHKRYDQSRLGGIVLHTLSLPVTIETTQLVLRFGEPVWGRVKTDASVERLSFSKVSATKTQ